MEKGNTYTISGDTVTFTKTSGDGVEYWTYQFDLLNRLTEVDKNGSQVATYKYSPDGLRQVKTAKGVTTHYVFEGTEPIFEKRISDGRIRSYVYALGKHLARVDGHEEKNADGEIVQVIDNTYWYTTDYLGSVRVITNATGVVVWNADYGAFGKRIGDSSQSGFDNDLGFTGKDYDEDSELYYYNARWYDPELGRFLSEDPAADPNSPNLYCYGANNPVMNTDPTGRNPLAVLMIIGAIFGGLNSCSHGGSFWSGAIVGAASAAFSWGVGEAFQAWFATLSTTAGTSAGIGATAVSSWTTLGVYVCSGAVSGGILSNTMGGDFWEGFGTGAVSGFLAWGADQVIPDKFSIESLKKDPLKDIARFGAKYIISSKGNVTLEGFLQNAAGCYITVPGADTNSDLDPTEKELKEAGINIKGDVVRVKKTQTTKDGVVTTKYEIYVSSDLTSTSFSVDDSLLKGQKDTTSTGNSLSVDTNRATVMMTVSIKSTGELTVDAHLGFENKYITMPYGKLNGEFSGNVSRDTTSGIDSTSRMWRRYQWDTTVTKDHANLDVGILYRSTDETEISGNWAHTDKMYVKIDFSSYLK